jgi:PAS domain S-box-containing protein
VFKLLEGTADAAFAVDQQGVICSWNRAAEKLFGYRESEVLHQPCAPLFQGCDSLGTRLCAEPCSVMGCIAAHQGVSNYDLAVKVRSGETIWVNVSILVFDDDRTHRQLIIHLARDISRRKKSEDLAAKLVHLAREITLLPDDAGSVPPVSPLTEQECKVLRLLAEGKTAAQVARELRITPRTLRNHLHHANQKLHTSSRLEAVTQATRRGLL